VEDSVRRIIPREQRTFSEDALEMGPNVLPAIFAILLRFTLHHTAIVGDITQALLQLVPDEDHALTRFLWYRTTPDGEGGYRTTNEVITYRFTRLAFGLTCSPFLLFATLRELRKTQGSVPGCCAPYRQKYVHGRLRRMRAR